MTDGRQNGQTPGRGFIELVRRSIWRWFRLMTISILAAIPFLMIGNQIFEFADHNLEHSWSELSGLLSLSFGVVVSIICEAVFSSQRGYRIAGGVVCGVTAAVIVYAFIGLGINLATAERGLDRYFSLVFLNIAGVVLAVLGGIHAVVSLAITKWFVRCF